MPIKCQICGKEFSSLISSTHLKQHDVKTQDYIDLYGKESLTSEEYRKRRSLNSVGDKNSNYGNKWTEEQKNKLSNVKRGKPSKIKGVTKEHFTQDRLDNIKLGIEKREKKYQSGALIRKIRPMTDELREKLSTKAIAYSISNPENVKRRGERSVSTKIKNGYFSEKRKNTINLDIDTFLKYDLIAEHIDQRLYKLSCKKCDTVFTRGSGQWHDNMCPGCGRQNSVSKTENEVYEAIRLMIPDHEILQSDKTIMHPFEIDIYIPEKRMAIEFNGLYWHCESAGKNKWYHKTKRDKCLEKGITLIQIFEDEWIHSREKVIQRLKSKFGISKKIHARKCEIREIDNKMALNFFDKYHLQGRGQSKMAYGLFFEGELVACMSFSDLNRSKGFRERKDSYFELNRYASIGNVIGGASRLFSRFIKEKTPHQIVTYSDLRWNSGNMYKALGFEYVGDTTPGYWYISGTKRIHRFKLRKTEQDPKNITEYELRKSEGYHRIWDCGHAKYIWNIKT